MKDRYVRPLPGGGEPRRPVHLRGATVGQLAEGPGMASSVRSPGVILDPKNLGYVRVLEESGTAFRP